MSALRSGSQPGGGKDLPTWLVASALAAACILGYYPILSAGFLCDDFCILYAVQNGTIADIGSGGVYFRPIGLISFALDWHLFDDRAFWFHLVNLALHFATSVGVAVLARLLIERPSAALVAGLVFALHPAHPEAVTWIAGRFDVLCGALLVWSLVCHIKRQESDAGQAGRLHVVSLVLFGLACLSKEQAFVFPLVILLYELFRFGEPPAASMPLWARARRAIPFFVVAAILFGVRYARIGGIGGDYSGESSEYSLAVLLYHITVQPLLTLFVPANRSILEAAGVPSALAVGAVLLSPVLFVLRARWRVLAFCVAAIILDMLPSGHFGLAGGALQNSRFLYTPSIFFAILIAELLTVEVQGRLKSVAAVLIVVYCSTLLLVLHQNNNPWQEAGVLVRTATESSDALVERHKGEWGTKYGKLLTFNVPTDYIGAWTFRNGLSEMLRLRHGDELDRVEIEVMYGGIQAPENIERIERASQEAAVIWWFDDLTRSFVENEPGE